MSETAGPLRVGPEHRKGDRRHDERRSTSRRPEGRHRERRRSRRRTRLARASLVLTLLASMSGHKVAAHKGTKRLKAGLDPVPRPESLQTVVPFLTELNDRVRQEIDRYANPDFGVALARGAQYLPTIQQIFAAAGVPRELAYVALVESEFRATALSPARARGIWQFMPMTGERFGLQQDEWLDERGDPFKATRAAAQYLATLHRLFGDWNLALAAYNAGEGRILRATRRYDTRDFWELARLGAVPIETRNYVPRIHAAIHIAEQPQQYGIQPADIVVPSIDVVTVDDAVDLQALSECAGADVEELLDVNPELRRWATPAGRSFDLKVPSSLERAVSTCLRSLPAGGLKLHVVKRGQSLASLARLYGRRESTLAAANALNRKQRLTPGAELIIPGAD